MVSYSPEETIIIVDDTPMCELSSKQFLFLHYSEEGVVVSITVLAGLSMDKYLYDKIGKRVQLLIKACFNRETNEYALVEASSFEVVSKTYKEGAEGFPEVTYTFV